MNVLKYALRNISPQTLQELQEHYPNASVNIKLTPKPKREGLTDADFWGLIRYLDWSKAGDDKAVIAPVINALCKKSFRHILDFADILSHKLYLLDGDIYAQKNAESALDSDFVADRFLYTRCCVVANGLTFFSHIRKHPTEMPHDRVFAALLTIPNEAFKQLTGRTLDHVWAYPIETFSNSSAWPYLKLTENA